MSLYLLCFLAVNSFAVGYIVMNYLSWTPIGEMHTCFKTKNGTPRQGTVSSNSKGVLTISKQVFTNPDHSLEGLKDYSYVWILFAFHLNANKSVKAKVKPPRLDGAKIGVFATRSPHRPNPIGLTLAKLESLSGATVTVSGVDIVDGTPVLDIKPYIPMYDIPQHDVQNTSAHICDSEASGSSMDSQVTEPYATEVVNSSIWHKTLLPKLNVSFTKRAECDILNLQETHNSMPQFMVDRQHIRDTIIDILKEDPRSTYRRKKCSDRLYYFELDDCHVTAWFDYSCEPVLVEVLRIKPTHEAKSFLESNHAEAEEAHEG